MSEPKPREWLFYIDDMIRFAEKAVAYTKDLERSGCWLRSGTSARFTIGAASRLIDWMHPNHPQPLVKFDPSKPDAPKGHE